MQTFFRHIAFAGLLALTFPQLSTAQNSEEQKGEDMKLGEFSVSLTVADIHTSKAFYEKLGFKQIGGEIEQNWVIMQNGSANIGLFQGMFEENILTFNPEDVRGIQRRLKEQDVEIVTEADEESEGPAHMVITDPDGNLILLDQW